MSDKGKADHPKPNGDEKENQKEFGQFPHQLAGLALIG
jgi:hypothetical protein